MAGSAVAEEITSFYRSIIDIKAYSEFRTRPAGRAFLYLLLLTLVLGGISAVRLAVEMNAVIASATASIKKNIPDFRLDKNGIKVNAPMPYVKELDKDFILAIDTTGKTDKEIFRGRGQGVLITASRIIYKENELKITDYDIKSLGGVISLSKGDIERYLSYAWVIIVITLPFYLIFFYAAKLFSALIVAVLGLIINSVLKTGVSFEDLFKLSIYALTAPIILKIAVEFTSYPVPYFFLVYYGVGLLYLWLALRRISANAAPSS